MDNYTLAFNQMQNGSLILGIDTQLVESTGGMWYVVLFGIPIIMIYMKTESIVLPAVLTCWSIALYGYLIDPAVSTLAAIAMAAGFAILFLTLFWRKD